MIWIRRLISIPLSVVFLLLLMLTLIVVQASDTFLDPDYYQRELRDADIYEFLLTDLLTSALDDARKVEGADLPKELEKNPLVSSGLSTEAIVASINAAVPPEFVQGLVEQAFDQIGHYLTGERDEFAVTVTAGDQVVTMVEEVKSLLREADAYDLLFDEVVTPFVEDALVQELPLGLDGLDLSADRLVSAVKATVPPDWVQTQVEAALDEVTPYVVGEKDSFKINIHLADRVDVALEEIKRLLRETDAYDLLYDEVIGPRLAEAIGGSVELSSAITVTADEIVDALKQVAPPENVQVEAERIIDEAAPYIVGEVDSFSIVVSLADNKLKARPVLEGLINEKLDTIFAGLPPCTEAQLLQLGSSVGTDVELECTPTDVGSTNVAERISTRIADVVQAQVVDSIPDTIEFTDATLRQTLTLAGAEDYIERIDDVRELLRDGWTYTDVDLRADTARSTFWDGEDVLDALDNTRDFLADGWTYTDVDFRKDVEGTIEFTFPGFGLLTGSDVAEFESIRDRFKTARKLRWLIWLPMVVLLIIIGFLGGRSWTGRVIWASVPLIISAAVMLILFGPVYDNVVSEPQFDKARARVFNKIHVEEEFEGTATLAADKIVEIADSAVGGFASGMATYSLAILAIGIAALVIVSAYSLLIKRRPD